MFLNEHKTERNVQLLRFRFKVYTGVHYAFLKPYLLKNLRILNYDAIQDNTIKNVSGSIITTIPMVRLGQFYWIIVNDSDLILD